MSEGSGRESIYLPFQLLQYIKILIIKTDSKRDIVIKYAGKFRSGPKYIKKIIYNKGRISDQARKLGLLIKNLEISHLRKKYNLHQVTS